MTKQYWWSQNLVPILPWNLKLVKSYSPLQWLCGLRLLLSSLPRPCCPFGFLGMDAVSSSAKTKNEWRRVHMLELLCTYSELFVSCLHMFILASDFEYLPNVLFGWHSCQHLTVTSFFTKESYVARLICCLERGLYFECFFVSYIRTYLWFSVLLQVSRLLSVRDSSMYDNASHLTTFDLQCWSKPRYSW